MLREFSVAVDCVGITNESFRLPGCYAAWVGSLLRTFRQISSCHFQESRSGL